MGRGIVSAQLSRFEEMGKRVEESSTGKRREGFNLTYEIADAVKSAFGIFLFQHLSMLSYQESLDRGNQRKNAENILNVKRIPCNNQITRLIDGIKPEAFEENFKDGIGLAEKHGVFEQYRVLDLPRASGFLRFDSSGRGLVPIVRKSVLSTLFIPHQGWKKDVLS
ncbi:hypothetical protein FACS189479_06700 [Spirochaetia bacterium]|nr:hypothetical protein FACS189479_06700 [Spirochaetia bacterium]